MIKTALFTFRSSFIVLFYISPLLSYSQTPENQQLKEYVILDQSDTVRFYVYNADTTPKTKIFLYIQGSVNLPMVNSTDSIPCCFINFPRQIMRNFPKEYAFVYIQKIGLPYYANIDQFQLSSTFTNRNNVDDRARVASRVLNYLIKKVYPKTRTVAVLGHSEGSDVVVRLARWNKNVTHICFASGSGNNVWMDYASLTRRRMFEGKISAESAQQRIDTLWQGMQLVKTDPYSTTKYFHGDTYRWWTAINTPSLEYLKAIQIPIFLTIGSHDEKVPVEGSDLIVSEFRRLGKTNLTYKIYPRANHSFVEMKPNGDRTDHFLEMFLDFAAFVKTYQVKK